MSHANLSGLCDGRTNALSDDGVAALHRDIKTKEVLAEGLVPHRPPHPEDKGEGVDPPDLRSPARASTHSLFGCHVLLRLAHFRFFEAVSLIPRSRKLQEVECAALFVPRNAIGPAVRLTGLGSHVVRSPSKVEGEVLERSLVPELPPREP
eukprot:3203659-Rhodomonas_salina.1